MRCRANLGDKTVCPIEVLTDCEQGNFLAAHTFTFDIPADLLQHHTHVTPKEKSLVGTALIFNLVLSYHIRSLLTRGHRFKDLEISRRLY